LASRLSWLSDDRSIHNPDRSTETFFDLVCDVFPKQFDTQESQPFLAVAQAFEQGDIRNVGPLRQLSAHNRLLERVPRASATCGSRITRQHLHRLVLRPDVCAESTNT
jgi:hypothetical protein